MRRFHIAIAVADMEAAVADYSRRLDAAPELVIPGEYALWRTAGVNLSIRQVPLEQAGQVRHLGWEDPAAAEFTAERDTAGLLWERFNAEQQAAEINELWPQAGYRPRSEPRSD